MRRRFITRRVPGFTWIQVGIRRSWRWNHFWAVRGFARTHNLGFIWVCTMRSDAIERAKRPGGEFHNPEEPA